ncbi:MAG: hypothetical protein M1830_001722 [Pleopsidium flavum]|nr:MAG: hypothetical protein M1830_001722 [Pleopsidium flavum]
MEDVTTGVHDNSFTRNLIEELRDGAKNGLTTWELNGRMMHRRGRNQLFFTPRHFPLLNTNTPSIELCPLRGSFRLHPEEHLHGGPGNLSNKLTTPSLTETSTVSTEDEDSFFRGRILLSISLSDWTIPPTSAEWLEWLRVRAPRNIESVSARFQRSGGQGDINRTVVQPQDPLKWVGGLTSLPEHGRSQRLEEALVLTEYLRAIQRYF